MSIDQSQQVDAIGVDKSTGRVVLTISDHIPWTNPLEHCALLRNKINTYLGFIESGELTEAYPDARGRAAVISVVGKYALSEEGQEFYRNATGTASSAGICLEFVHVTQQ